MSKLNFVLVASLNYDEPPAYYASECFVQLLLQKNKK